MYFSEKDVKILLIEMFDRFKAEYHINPKPFIVTLANYFGEQIPQQELSGIKYNLFIDVLHEMYGKKK